MEKSNITLFTYLKDYSDMPATKMSNFRNYYPYSLQEFIKLSLGNRAYKNLQEECVQFLAQRAVDVGNDSSAVLSTGLIQEPTDEWTVVDCCLERIEDVPFSSHLFDMVFPYDIAGKLNCVKQQPFQRMVDLLDVDRTRFFKWESAGEAKWTCFKKVKDYLMNEDGRRKVLEIYNLCFVRYTFPTQLNLAEEEYNLSDKIDIAIRQYMDMLERMAEYKSEVKKELPRLKMIFTEKLTKKEIAARLGITNERARQIKIDSTQEMYNGTLKGAETLSFSDSLKAEIDTFLNRLPEICSEKTLCEKLGCENYEESLVSILLPLESAPKSQDSLGTSGYTEFDQIYYIGKKRSIKWTRTYLKSISNVLGRSSSVGFDVRPMNIDCIMELLDMIKTDEDFEFDQQTVMDILEQHSWVEQVECDGEMKYQLRYDQLKSNYKCLARLVYEHGTVMKSDMDALHRAALQDNTADSINNAFNTTIKNIPWVIHSGQSNVLVYDEQGTVRKTMRQAIREWAEEHVLFRMDEIRTALAEMGYMEPAEKTLRTYILESCKVDNKQRDLFCHNNHTDRYTDGYHWRSNTQNGVTNWLMNLVHADLMESPDYSLPVKELENHMMEAVEHTEYVIKRNLCMYLSRQLQDGAIIFVKDDRMYLTEKGQKLTVEELETLGNRSRKPGYYDVVLSMIVAALKEVESGELRLLDLRNNCEEAIPELTRPAFYKIVDTTLPEQVVKVERDGKIYLKLLQEKMEYAEAVVLQTVQDAQATEKEPVMVKDETVRPVLAFGQRPTLDWTIIRQDLCTKLGYYAAQWRLGMSFEKGVDKFIRFIGQLDVTQNTRLTTILPNSLMMLWHYRNDTFSYMYYLSNIVTCYERLLREIHSLNTGEVLSTKGLGDTAVKMDYFCRWQSRSTRWNDDAFLKYFNSLRVVRNHLAHGEELVSQTSSHLQEVIYQFVALYIFTVAKFWEE